MAGRSRFRRPRTRLGSLFQRANRWQKAGAVVLALVAVHGIYVVFVPGVQLANPALGCPPAAVAAFAGKGGFDSPEGLAAAHDAACASTARWWLLAAGGQTAVAAIWGLALLEWARVSRRVRRRRRRRERARRQSGRRQGASAPS